ncbi:O-antigen ligase family protein [Rhodocaloribacter litoris]|uniref:O-antigen ligase family protein n=1 Tax=Rhodocaloribacter litoris TaxID=2558931 RepID=UPI001E60DA17|nr:O-antigen ligase family protein [Rhodocaloribacter litoris]QXD16178.1 O-antigen ligase family protein [Rhodocaloribacter litoris]
MPYSGRPEPDTDGQGQPGLLQRWRTAPVLWHVLAWAVGLTAFAAVMPFGGEIVLIGAALHALRGARQTVEALFILALAIMINKALVPVDISLLRWVVLAAAAGRTIWDSLFSDEALPPAFGALVVLTVTLVFLGLVVSWMPTVSVFKAISFFLGVGTGLVALYRTRHLARYWEAWLLTLAVFTILGSLPLYALPQYAYARNGVGFQGILTHPQTYGPMTAILTAYVTGRVLFDRLRSPLLWLTVAAGWAGIYFSQSRTGMLALVLAGVLVVIAGLLKTRTWLPHIRRAFNLPVIALGVLAVAAFGYVYGPRLSEGIVTFLLKDEAAQDVTTALEDSRGALIERSMDNFRRAPVTGIGLGVPSDPAGARVEYGPFGVPVSASVEKGFQPAAVLEETGVAGAMLLVLFLATLLWPVFIRGTLPLAWMVTAALLVNMGEAILFAIGGNGLFVWLVLSLAYVTAGTMRAYGSEFRRETKRAGGPVLEASPARSGV